MNANHKTNTDERLRVALTRWLIKNGVKKSVINKLERKAMIDWESGAYFDERVGTWMDLGELI